MPTQSDQQSQAPAVRDKKAADLQESRRARRMARERGFRRFVWMWSVTAGLAVANGLTLRHACVAWTALALNALCMVAAIYDLWALRHRWPVD